MQLIFDLSNPTTLSGNQSIEYYTKLWVRAFPNGSQKSKRYYRMRLQELETWDTSNNKPNERAGKIAALKHLLK